MPAHVYAIRSGSPNRLDRWLDAAPGAPDTLDLPVPSYGDTFYPVRFIVCSQSDVFYVYADLVVDEDEAPYRLWLYRVADPTGEGWSLDAPTTYDIADEEVDGYGIELRQCVGTDAGFVFNLQTRVVFSPDMESFDTVLPPQDYLYYDLRNSNGAVLIRYGGSIADGAKFYWSETGGAQFGNEAPFLAQDTGATAVGPASAFSPQHRTILYYVATFVRGWTAVYDIEADTHSIMPDNDGVSPQLRNLTNGAYSIESDLVYTAAARTVASPGGVPYSAGGWVDNPLIANTTSLLYRGGRIQPVYYATSPARLVIADPSGAMVLGEGTGYYSVDVLDVTPPLPPPEPDAMNCDCEDPSPNKTLAAYRRDVLVRAGFAAVANNPPPGARELIDAFLRDAQDFLYRKYPALNTRRFFRWSMQQGVRYYGMRDNDDSGGSREQVTISNASPAVVTWTTAPQNGRRVSFSVAEGGSLPAPLEVGTQYYTVNRDSTTCQLSLVPGGTAINTTTAGSGAITAYSHPGPGCIFDMEPYKNIEGAWLVDLNGQWIPMVCGIPPTFYTTVNNTSLPMRYEIRQCIEIFPAPPADGYYLYIKGHFGLRPFEIDTDKPTIDGQLVYLWALANALDYYGKPSAAGVAEQAREHLGRLVAGTHTGRRYVPGTRPLPPAVMPVLAPGTVPP